ncbi:CHRNA2 [Mytilus coruscus]|uniref:CHRNA2 n=1 Tax=Mytilus coruscus TaxID=42192 RepID=A0A6J8CJ98_MYTCO|nr:CHRNA2 [Mytilus coruscus]
MCADHFEASCFDGNLMGRLIGFTPRHRRLKSDAVPTVFAYNQGLRDDSNSQTRKRVLHEMPLPIDNGVNDNRGNSVMTESKENNIPQKKTRHAVKAVGEKVDVLFSRTLYDTILSNYSRHVKPRQLNADVVNIYIDFDIKAVIDFEEKSGIFTFLGKFTLKWWDEIIMWDSTNYGNIDMIQVSIHDVWVPKIVIGNTVDYHSLYKMDNYFDSKMTYITYTNDGSAFFESSGVWQTICNVDVTDFPFDAHECDILLEAMHPSMDVKLMSISDYVHTNSTTMHSEFRIQNTYVRTRLLNAKDAWSQLAYTINLGRRPLFMTMNLVVPVFLISFANVLVFLLPLDSSDRVGYAVTMVLTFTVFMTMVSDLLPATDPLSNFNILLILQLTFSTVVTLGVLLIHFIYNKNPSDNVPHWIRYLCLRKTNQQDEPINKKGKDKSYQWRDCDSKIWKKMARIINKCILVKSVFIITIEIIVFYGLTCT